MTNHGRDIFVLLRNEFITEDEVAQLNQILRDSENPDTFCACHQLVDRNSITSNRKKIIKETKHRRLRAFRFLIAKN